MKYSLKNTVKAGFSLVEMLVVIAVIGIIAAIAIPNIGNINGAAKASQQQRNAQTIANVFAAATAGGADLSTQTTTAGIITALSTGVAGTAGMTFQLQKTWNAADETAIEGLLTYAAPVAPATQPTLSFAGSGQ